MTMTRSTYHSLVSASVVYGTLMALEDNLARRLPTLIRLVGKLVRLQH